MAHVIFGRATYFSVLYGLALDIIPQSSISAMTVDSLCYNHLSSKIALWNRIPGCPYTNQPSRYNNRKFMLGLGY